MGFKVLSVREELDSTVKWIYNYNIQIQWASWKTTWTNRRYQYSHVSNVLSGVNVIHKSFGPFVQVMSSFLCRGKTPVWLYAMNLEFLTLIASSLSLCWPLSPLLLSGQCTQQCATTYCKPIISVTVTSDMTSDLIQGSFALERCLLASNFMSN